MSESNENPIAYLELEVRASSEVSDALRMPHELGDIHRRRSEWLGAEFDEVLIHAYGGDRLLYILTLNTDHARQLAADIQEAIARGERRHL